MLTRTFFSRAPLAPSRFAALPAGAISAKGSSADRLLALRAELLSRCAALFPQTGERCAFYGGAQPGGTQAGDLLDAMLLTAAELGDEELLRQGLSLARRAVSAQREDGFFGSPEDSFAARGRMLRALQTAYSLSGDKQMLTFMLRYMKYLQDSLSASVLPAQDAMHIADTLECGVALYNITGQKAILPVHQLLIRQGADYTSLLHAFPYMAKSEALAQALELEGEDGYHHHLVRTASGVNLAEGLRASCLSGVVTGSGKHLSAAEAGLARIMKAHGAVSGAFTADPLLAGTHPSRGVQAVTACEMALSLEAMLACPGGEHGADALERVVYNAVNAAVAPDGRGVQAMQQANQVMLSRDLRFPFTADGANLFSVEDCGAMSALAAAWPRFIQRQWMLTRDDGLCAMGYAPCTVRYRLGGASVQLTVDSVYPAGGSVRIIVRVSEPAAFPLSLRIPAWASGASAAVGGEILSAKAGDMLTINRQWHDGDEVLLTLPMPVRVSPAYHQAVSVERGPLVFAYAPEAVEGVSEEGYRLLRAKAHFGVALVKNAAIDAHAEGGRVTLTAKAVPLPEWGMRGPSCDQPPLCTQDAGGASDVRLVPYAEAPIRLSVLPVV